MARCHSWSSTPASRYPRRSLLADSRASSGCCAFGALTYRERHLRLDLEALEHEADRVGGTIGGRDALLATIARVGQRRATLAELLPHHVPSDWIGAGSPYLFDEYERKARTVGAKLGREIDAATAAQLRRQVEAICVAGPAPFDPATVPRLTPDRDDDAIVYTALHARADLLISDDKHIVPRGSGGAHLYEHGDRCVLAVTFNRLMHEYLDDVDWSAIDGSWLREAYGELGPGQ